MPAFVRPALFRRVIRKFGKGDAKRQLRWLTSELSLLDGQNRPSLTGQLHRLLRDEPLAYVIGTQPFGPLSLRISPPVLIPRPETEEWTYELLNRLNEMETEAKDWKVLDICTGSGCIPLLLCKEWPGHLRGKISTYGIDIGNEAVALSRENALRAISAPESQTSFEPMKVDIFREQFSQWISESCPFDVVTSNPPYIPDKDWENLPTSVKYEDPRALQGGEDGLVFYRRIAELLATTPLLRPGGWLTVEFGIHQAEEVANILKKSGKLGSVEIWTDSFGMQRAAFCRAMAL